MTYIQFYNEWHRLACFSVSQVRAIYPDFHRGNFVQWQQAGYIVSLRQGWYAFANYLQQPDYARYFAGKICAPSYISLHTALSFYGIIPEAVVEITSVTTQKTCRYENAFGQFSYQTIRPRLFWGFEPKTMRDGKQYMLATPEKAIIDLLYLYPQYATLDEMRELRFDEDWMRDELNKERLMEYAERIGSPALTKRIKLLLKAYEI
jgi:predicted transcriptional regulator of viral defense system